MSLYTVRPLSDRTWLRSGSARKPTRFSSTWVETESFLLTEVEHLDGRNLVLEVDVREQDLRIDGTLRANAREASTPGVVVADESKHGPILHRCDTFHAPYTWQGPDWQHNVRAIALTLEALRTLDRYGAVDTGQQYAGFKALPAGRAMPASHMTTDQAREIITSLIGTVDRPCDTRLRLAKAAAHPDRHGGDRALWDQIEQAGRVLEASR